MSVSIVPYPSLNERLSSQIRFQHSEYSFFYVDEDGEEHSLGYKRDEINPSVLFIDDDGAWSHDDYEFSFKISISLRTFGCLFGKTGIACKNAKIGFAIQWTSNESKQRGVFKIDEFGYSDNSFQKDCSFSFPKGTLRGNVSLNIILYLAQAGSVEPDENHLINVPGHVLGELDSVKVFIDGNGSEFPIFEYTNPDDPLWKLNFSCEDPTSEQFGECVEICLNKAHRNFKYIDKNSSAFNEQLLSEIMAAALTAIVEEVKKKSEYWGQIVNGENLTEGSVGQALFYFMRTLEWELESSSINASLSIRRFFEGGKLCKGK